MKYEITKATAPAMPNLGKGTECVKLLLTQASKDMHEPPRSDVFPNLWRAPLWYGISVSGLQLEGADGHDGQSGGKKW